MAKYASALVRQGFSLAQIGFIVQPHLDGQPFVLRRLLQQQLNLSSEEAEKLAIGDELEFEEKNWTPRDVIIRDGIKAEQHTDMMDMKLVLRRYEICRALVT